MDPVCSESSSWMENAQVKKLSRGSAQPFYQVLLTSLYKLPLHELFFFYKVKFNFELIYFDLLITNSYSSCTLQFLLIIVVQLQPVE